VRAVLGINKYQRKHYSLGAGPQKHDNDLAKGLRLKYG
jgi:hypothetical protein